MHPFNSPLTFFWERIKNGANRRAMAVLKVYAMPKKFRVQYISDISYISSKTSTDFYTFNAFLYF